MVEPSDQKLKWEDVGLKDEDMISTLEENYSSYPTEIQTSVLDSVLDEDQFTNQWGYFVHAPGGCGKTLCFTIPAVNLIIRAIKNNEIISTIFPRKTKNGKIIEDYYPIVLILADTRLLAEQIKGELDLIIPPKYKDIIQTSCLYSAEPVKNYGQILIGMPGSIMKLIPEQNDPDNGQIVTKSIKLFVCDEAEKLFDIYQPSLDYICSKVKQNRDLIIIAASATLTENFRLQFNSKTFENQSFIECMVAFSLKGVKQLSMVLITSLEDELNVAFNEIIRILEFMFLKNQASSQVLIFIESIKSLNIFKNKLQQHELLNLNVKYDCIHSKLGEEQFKKDNNTTVIDKTAFFKVNEIQNLKSKSIYDKFKKGDFQLLFSTDLISRGIDIDKVGLVINVFAPRLNLSNKDSLINTKCYLHRVARTGRYLRKGISLTLMRPGKFEQRDQQIFDQLKADKDIAISNEDIIQEVKGDYYQWLYEEVKLCIDFNLTYKNEKKAQKIIQKQ